MEIVCWCLVDCGLWLASCCDRLLTSSIVVLVLVGVAAYRDEVMWGMR